MSVRVSVSSGSVLTTVSRGCLICAGIYYTGGNLCVSCSGGDANNRRLLPSPFIASVYSGLGPALACRPCRGLDFGGLPRAGSTTFSRLYYHFSSAATIGAVSRMLSNSALFRGLGSTMGGGVGDVDRRGTGGLFNGSVCLSTAGVSALGRYHFSCFYGCKLHTRGLETTSFGILRHNGVIRCILRGVVDRRGSGVYSVSSRRLCGLASFCVRRCLTRIGNFGGVHSRHFSFLLLEVSESLGRIIIRVTGSFGRDGFGPITYRFGVNFRSNVPLMFPCSGNGVGVHNDVSHISGFCSCMEVISCGANDGAFGLPSVVCNLGVRVLLCLCTVAHNRNVSSGGTTTVLCVPTGEPMGSRSALAVGKLVGNSPSVDGTVRPRNGNSFMPPLGVARGKRVDGGSPCVRRGNFSRVFSCLRGVVHGANGLVSDKSVSISPISNERSPTYGCYSFGSIYFISSDRVLGIPSLSGSRMFGIVERTSSGNVWPSQHARGDGEW